MEPVDGLSSRPLIPDGPQPFGAGKWTQSINKYECEQTFHCPCRVHVTDRIERWFTTEWAGGNAPV